MIGIQRDKEMRDNEGIDRWTDREDREKEGNSRKGTSVSIRREGGGR